MSGDTYQMWKAVDPAADLEFLIRRYSDGATTVSTRPMRTGQAWGPELSLRPQPPAGAVVEPGRCRCGHPGCSDAQVVR